MNEKSYLGLQNVSNFSIKKIILLCLFLLLINFCESTTSFQVWDGETESELCSEQNHNKTCCYSYEFQCGNGVCIPQNKVCESLKYNPRIINLRILIAPPNPDCLDRSDEFGCYNSTCADRTNTNKCLQTCLDLPGNTSQCTCYKGYGLKRKFFSLVCEDIDECQIGAHYCSHACKNLNGTFTCECKEGFKNIPDQHGDSCKALDGNILIVYNSNGWIMTYDVENKINKKIIKVGKVDHLALDPATDIFYWSNENLMARSYLPGGSRTNVTAAYAQILESPLIRQKHTKDSLSIDWVAENIYWLSRDEFNESVSQIMMSKLDGRYIKTILEVVRPNSLIIDPEYGRMYWTSAGERPQIMSAWMNGMFRSTVVHLPNQNPTLLTMDHHGNGRLYWLDSITNTIYYINRNGKGSNKVLTTSQAKSPISIDVFENYLYWITKTSNELLRHNKFGLGKSEVLIDNLSDQRSMIVYHKRKLEVEIRKFGLNCAKQCSHICLHIPRGYSCTCPDGNKLVSLMGEIICDNVREIPAANPLACNCNDELICNSPNYKACNCSVKCPIRQEVFDEAEDTEAIRNMYGFPKYIKIVILCFGILSVIMCFVFSFYKWNKKS